MWGGATLGACRSRTIDASQANRLRIASAEVPSPRVNHRGCVLCFQPERDREVGVRSAQPHAGAVHGLRQREPAVFIFKLDQLNQTLSELRRKLGGQ